MTLADRLRAPLALVVLAPMLAVALVVTGGGTPAYALKPPIDIGKIGKEGLQIGQKIAGSEGAKAASLFGRFSNPVGWAITGGTAAWWAYDNRDSIADFLAGPDTPETVGDWKTFLQAEWLFGEQWGAEGTDARQYVKITSVIGNQIKFQHGCAAGVSNPYAGMYWCGPKQWPAVVWQNTANNTVHTPTGRARCVNRTTGAQRYVSMPTTPSDLGSGYGSPTGWTQNRTITVCGADEDILGFYVPPMDKQSPLPANPVGYSEAQYFGISWGFIELPTTAPTGTGDVSPDDKIVFQEAEVVARCKEAATGDTTTITATSDLGPSGTVVLPSCKQHLGDGWYGTGFTITPTKPETETGEPLPDEWEVPDFPPIEWDELLPDKDDADWQPCMGTKDGCSLSVWIDDIPCKNGDPRCNQWTRVLEKDPDKVKCMYGSRQVNMKNCYPLAYPLSNTAPDTGTAPGPGNSTSPGNGTQTNPGTGTSPGTGPGTGTGTSMPPAPAGATPAEVKEQSECFPKGWGMLNPFEWVYKPVKCALEWAFKPRTPLGTRLDRMRANIANRAPFSWVASLGALPTAIPGGGCPDWVLTTPNGQSKNIICGTGFGNAMRSARPVWAVLLVGAAFWPLIRGVFRASFPVIKPTGGD